MEAGLLSKEQIVQALAVMRANVRKVWAHAVAQPVCANVTQCPPGEITIGLSAYPPYPALAFPYEDAYHYQNAGDWTWWGGRIVQQLIRNNLDEDALLEIRPMVERVVRAQDFWEWYDYDNRKSGSSRFHGSAGVLATAIKMLQAKGL